MRKKEYNDEGEDEDDKDDGEDDKDGQEEENDVAGDEAGDEELASRLKQWVGARLHDVAVKDEHKVNSVIFCQRWF